MCGRFAQITSIESIKKLFNAKGKNIKIAKNYNLSPTQKAIIVYNKGKIETNIMNWGISPKWNPDLNIINIRTESLKTKKYFNKLLLKNRCIIPCDGFFEWKNDKSKKQPYFIKPINNKPFLLAGLYDEKQNEMKFAIITKPAEKPISDIHSRMPVILSLNDSILWLSNNNNNRDLMEILYKITESEISFFKVSPLVNNAGNNFKELIIPI